MVYLLDRLNIFLERAGSQHRIAWGDSIEEGLVELFEAIFAKIDVLEKNAGTRQDWSSNGPDRKGQTDA